MRHTHTVCSGTALLVALIVVATAAAPGSAPILVDDAGSSYSNAKPRLSSQLAIAEAMERQAEHTWSSAVSRQFDAYIEEHFTRSNGRLTARDASFASTFIAKADSFVRQFGPFDAAAQRLSASLAPTPAPAGAIAEFLAQPAGRATLFASASGEVVASPAAPSRSDPIEQALSDIFSPGPNGGLVIPAEKRAAAERQLAEGNKLIEAIDKAHARTQRVASRMNGDDDDTERFKRIVTHRTYAAASALKELGDMRTPDYDALPKRVSDALKKVLREDGDDEYRLPSRFFRRSLMESLDNIESLAAKVESIRPSVRAVADRLPETDELHRGWKRMLLDEATLINLAGKVGSVGGGASAGGGVAAQDFSATPLGRYLVPAKGGGVRVNRFRANMAAAELEKLEQPLRAYQLLEPRFNDLARQVEGTRLREAFNQPAVRAVLATAFAARAGAAASESAAVSAPIEKSQESRLSTVLDSMESPLVVDLRGDAFKEEPIELFRSSIFFNPRTALSRQLYAREFLDHHAARLFGLFEWNALQSTDLRSYLARLEQERLRVAELARTHDALVIMINFMPSWLSRSRDDSPLDGHYLAKHGSRPRDWGEWERLVLETVEFMEQFRKGNDLQIYYEIWNEPDGYWAEDIDAYLELYERTATAIKKASPSSKVGGCGINHWKGKVKASPNREPVNIELIRFCGKRNLPLDFVSWHQFTRPASQLTDARAFYEKELRGAGFRTMPEFVVSEWNVAEKGSSFEAVSFAETMVEFVSAGVDMQTYASWEEFNADEPDPDSYGPWGLITQKGDLKPPYFVHKFFDRLSRDSKGIAIFESADKRTKAVVSRKSNGEFEAMIWEVGLYGPRMDAAVKALADAGLRNDDLKAYGDLEGLESAIRRGKPADRAHAKAFESARLAYEQSPQQHNYIVLAFEGVGRIDLLDTESVYNSVSAPAAAASGNRVAIKAERNEVVWLKFRAD